LTANIWIVPPAAVGSTSCSRIASPVTLAAAQTSQKCDDGANSLDDACEAAQSGDVIRVQEGTDYAGQNVTCTNAFTVTVLGNDPEGVEAWQDIIPDATTIWAGLDFAATSDIALSGVTIADPDAACAPTNKLVDMQGVDDVTLHNVNATRIADDGNYLECDLGSMGDTDGLVWTGSNICCNMNQKLMQLDNFGGGPNGTITFCDGRLGEQVWGVGDVDVHAEGWWLQDTGLLVLCRWVTVNTISSGAMNWGGSGNSGVLWTNTVWGPTYAYGAVDVLPGSPVGYRGGARDVLIEGANTNGTGTIEYSILDGYIVFTGLSSLTFRGNLYRDGGCGGSITRTYNRQTGADCSATDVQDTGAFDVGRFVDKAAGDYRPASTSVAQVGAGDPANFPATDLLGVSRPQGTNPDQGAFEIVGGG
jgi:hypothetical protein